MLTQYGAETAADTVGDAVSKCLTTRLKEFHQRWTISLFYQKHEQFLHLLSETMKHAAGWETRTYSFL